MLIALTSSVVHLLMLNGVEVATVTNAVTVANATLCQIRTLFTIAQIILTNVSFT